MTRAASFDHLVGGNKQLLRDAEAEHPGALAIDDQLQLGRLQDRQVRRLGTLQDTARVHAHLTIGISHARSVTHQPTDFRIETS